MKQLLLRVDDELHAALTRRARASGQSVNAFANEILSVAANADPESARDQLRSRAAAMGMLSAVPPLPLAEPLTAEQRQTAIESARGWGPVIDDILDEDRGRL